MKVEFMQFQFRLKSLLTSGLIHITLKLQYFITLIYKIFTKSHNPLEMRRNHNKRCATNPVMKSTTEVYILRNPCYITHHLLKCVRMCEISSRYIYEEREIGQSRRLQSLRILHFPLMLWFSVMYLLRHCRAETKNVFLFFVCECDKEFVFLKKAMKMYIEILRFTRQSSEHTKKLLSQHKEIVS